MKLWLLRPRADDELPDENPWEPWYDKAFGFVVAAPSEEVAREMAQIECGYEGKEAWASAHYSTCVELVPPSKASVIIRDMHYA